MEVQVHSLGTYQLELRGNWSNSVGIIELTSVPDHQGHVHLVWLNFVRPGASKDAEYMSPPTNNGPTSASFNVDADKFEAFHHLLQTEKPLKFVYLFDEDAWGNNQTPVSGFRVGNFLDGKEPIGEGPQDENAVSKGPFSFLS